jgi:thiamine kinase-like enzyme
MCDEEKALRGLRSELEYHLRLLVNYLASADQPNSELWQDWQITRLEGGANNRLFRARHSRGDFVIKFTIRDDRNRAEREFQALSALEQAELQIAPMPFLLDNTSYLQPVVVQTWIDGECLAQPPASDEEWQALMQYYLVVHSVTPDTSSIKLSTALSANTVAEGRFLVNQQLARIPREAQPIALQNLVRQFEEIEIQEWEKAPVTLCRIDPNLSNFIRTVNGLASVDWEYSGWGDPAFDIADLMAHPTYMDVPSSRWAWLIQVYADSVNDLTAGIRIGGYYKILLIWWVARMARFLYEVPRGLDNRLASLPADWQADAQMKYDHYLNLAEAISVY